jgi:hypothetical protein
MPSALPSSSEVLATSTNCSTSAVLLVETGSVVEVGGVVSLGAEMGEPSG